VQFLRAQERDLLLNHCAGHGVNTAVTELYGRVLTDRPPVRVHDSRADL
jgi:hypothetical protein